MSLKDETRNFDIQNSTEPLLEKRNVNTADNVHIHSFIL